MESIKFISKNGSPPIKSKVTDFSVNSCLFLKI